MILDEIRKNSASVESLENKIGINQTAIAALANQMQALATALQQVVGQQPRTQPVKSLAQVENVMDDRMDAMEAKINTILSSRANILSRLDLDAGDIDGFADRLANMRKAIDRLNGSALYSLRCDPINNKIHIQRLPLVTDDDRRQIFSLDGSEIMFDGFKSMQRDKAK